MGFRWDWCYVHTVFGNARLSDHCSVQNSSIIMSLRKFLSQFLFSTYIQRAFKVNLVEHCWPIKNSDLVNMGNILFNSQLCQQSENWS